MEENLQVHYYNLPKIIYVALKSDFHQKLCLLAQKRTNCKFKHCLYQVLGCTKLRASRLFDQKVRFTIGELELIQEYCGTPKEEVEQNIGSIGNHEDGAIIKNPSLPFQLKDLFYVASHLIFDGCFRPKKGNYFYVYENDLLEYHKKRLRKFGDVPLKFYAQEHQLYFSYTLGFIVKEILEIHDFRSTKCILSGKFKNLAKKYKILTDEVIKSLIVDEGSIEDKVKIELANRLLVEDLCEIIKPFYSLRKVISRTRTISFKENKWEHTTTTWSITFSSKSQKKLYHSVSPLPIGYKEKSFYLLTQRKFKPGNKLKKGEMKKLIIRSLLSDPKTLSDLAEELNIRAVTIAAHIYNRHPTYSTNLKQLGIVKKVGERIMRRGGYAKANVFGIDDLEKAKEFIKS